MMYPALHANQNEASIATPMSQQAFGTMPNNPTTNHEHVSTERLLTASQCSVVCFRCRPSEVLMDGRL